MAWATITGRRPELEAIEVNYPEGYIGLRIYPKERKTTKTGTITRNFFASANTSFSCAEVIARASIAAQEVESFGGIEVAEEHGARMVKRAIMAKMEKAAAEKVMASDAPYTPGTGELVDTIRDAAESIKNYGGRLALVCSLSAYGYIMNLQEVRTRLSFSGTREWDRETLLSLRPEVLREMLQQMYTVEEILVGDNMYWPANKVAVVKLPSEEPMSYKLAPELGKTIAYSTDGVDVCEIESDADYGAQVDDFTGKSYYNIVELNSGARKVIQLFEEESSSGSSSSSSGE